MHEHIALFITANYDDKREKVHEHIDKAIDIYSESLESGIYPKGIQQRISLGIIEESDYREGIHKEISRLLQTKLNIMPNRTTVETDITT